MTRILHSMSLKICLGDDLPLANTRNDNFTVLISENDLNIMVQGWLTEPKAPIEEDGVQKKLRTEDEEDNVISAKASLFKDENLKTTKAECSKSALMKSTGLQEEFKTQAEDEMNGRGETEAFIATFGNISKSENGEYVEIF